MFDARAQPSRLLAALAVALASAASAAAAQAATASKAEVRTGQRCYLVGQRVSITGSGFAGSSLYDVTLDGVDFGQSVTSGSGGFTTALAPGGLAAGQAQIVDLLDASDGTREATTTFTVTRPAGALFGAGHGDSPTRTVPFEVWDFAPSGAQRAVYLHYVAPSAATTRTVAIGTTTGECGYLRSKDLPLFPFAPRRGRWTLQFDPHRAYSSRPTGPVARLTIAIS